ncbi:ATP synthase F1 subunit gamma [Candidatus Uhrbacteria bacterium]|nr:ATP synthase F1 subunit gamma [Candidatus Uhrbacteria bacterium]
MKGTLQIRRQIRSIGNTKKMTKAMELVSAAKMRKAIVAVLATRPYATFAQDVLRFLASRTVDASRHPLLEVRALRKAGFIVISTNRGLCGSFNATLASTVRHEVTRAKEDGASSSEALSMGKRARDILARSGLKISADFLKKDMTTSIIDVLPLAHTIIERYGKGNLDRVYVAYTDYISSVKQKPVCKQLLPLELGSGSVSQSESVPDPNSVLPSSEGRHKEFAGTLFEPSETQVLSYVIPRLLEVQLYQAVLESEASEHSARMLAMHNASEAATDILSELRLAYNQIRQAGITQEIAEISSGRAALE